MVLLLVVVVVVRSSSSSSSSSSSVHVLYFKISTYYPHIVLVVTGFVIS
jgi:uncharacterized membrane protein (DUF106 family)